MLVVNVKRVGGRLHSCCRMMLASIFVLSKYDPDLCSGKKFPFRRNDAKCWVKYLLVRWCLYYICCNLCANLWKLLSSVSAREL